ncbi:bifunctional diaminohydroxyphosphoribosylaminopyrimidine deaminase/5-amino-6-(5-phosphoribosylamino)uracil reductase RibD [bacterium]|nr:bifunctional diaminohydroxyphosphoribosylaminopyrimidine deaminase/5-amino-6-(5-phosphoribosylamino)uracil reductase RibD [bacterium]
MRRALSLAKRGRTSPNPMVGAVIVKDGEIVGEGYHPKAGEPHAEVFALREAGDRAAGAVMYVTLEPCCHQGRTPPCTQAIIKAGISEVYAAMTDPDPKVSSKGLDELRSAGIKVHNPLLEEEARALNEAYIKHRTTGLPFVILKSAMSIDGKIATCTGDSKWITNERSRVYAHGVRSRVDAIIVGGGTARTDDPALTARIGRTVYYPIRVVITGTGDLSPSLKLFNEPGESIVAAGPYADAASLRKLEAAGARIITLNETGCRPPLTGLMRELGTMGCLSVLIEGGGETAAFAIEERLVDKVLYFHAPIIIGGHDSVNSVAGVGAESISCAVKLDHIRVRRFGDDIAVEGYVVYPDTA